MGCESARDNGVSLFRGRKDWVGIDVLLQQPTTVAVVSTLCSRSLQLDVPLQVQTRAPFWMIINVSHAIDSTPFQSVLGAQRCDALCSGGRLKSAGRGGDSGKAHSVPAPGSACSPGSSSQDKNQLHNAIATQLQLEMRL